MKLGMDLFLLLTSKLAKFHQNRGWVGKKVYQLAWNYPNATYNILCFMCCLCLASFFHIFLSLCNLSFPLKISLLFIYLFIHHLFICNWLFISLISYLAQICLETHLVECSRERCMHTVFRSLDLV